MLQPHYPEWPSCTAKSTGSPQTAQYFFAESATVMGQASVSEIAVCLISAVGAERLSFNEPVSQAQFWRHIVAQVVYASALTAWLSQSMPFGIVGMQL